MQSIGRTLYHNNIDISFVPVLPSLSASVGLMDHIIYLCFPNTNHVLSCIEALTFIGLGP